MPGKSTSVASRLREIELRRLEVEVLISPSPGAERVAMLPGLDLIVHAGYASRKSALHFTIVDLAAAAQLVGQHERMFAVFVLEGIPNAFLFEQSRYEIEIRFAILHAVFAFFVFAREPVERVVGKTKFREYLLHDLND